MKTRRITRTQESRKQPNRGMDAHGVVLENLLARAANDEGLGKRAAATMMNCSPQTMYDMLARAGARHCAINLVDPFAIPSSRYRTRYRQILGCFASEHRCELS